MSTTPGWGAKNPSIARGPYGYKFTVRSSNFVLDPSGMIHQTVEPEGIIKTVNYIGDMDDDLNVLSLDEIDTSHVDGPILFRDVQGMEDCRLFWDYKNDSWRMSGAFRQYDSSGVPTIAVDTLGATYLPIRQGDAIVGIRDGGAKNVVIDRTVMQARIPGIPEKNWMPLGYGNEFFKGPWRHPRLDGHQLRGSSGSGWMQDGWYGLLHFCTWPGRMYWHLFCRMDPNGEVEAITRPFYFIEPGVEFANGMTTWNDHFVITFGFREARCFTARVPIASVLKELY